MKVVQLVPDEGAYLNTLGIAQYRAGNWNAAIEALENSNHLTGESFGFNGFFLAMAHWHLGKTSDARTWYDKSVEWMDKYKPTDEELRRFREEAAELLEIE